MEPMVRPTRSVSWNRRPPHESPRNRLEPPGTGTGTGTGRDRFQMEPEPDGTGTEPDQPGPWPCLCVPYNILKNEPNRTTFAPPLDVLIETVQADF